ncbi:MAG: DegT/DnrJ/EryC1/StrS family aminotransferase [Nitrospinales bacterium]
MNSDFLANNDIQAVIGKFRLPEPVYVTCPKMPPLESYTSSLAKIWKSRWLTNSGPFHQDFEEKLKRYLGVENLNLFVNGTIALLVALQALRIDSGEVITTPFTFPASTHVLHWNRIRPVFCDIDPKTFNIAPEQIERHISSETKAILGVHVYGSPCDVEAIQTIADRHGLQVIYDAAHAFGVKIGERSVLEYGDISALSFHATKLFSSIEGGALIPKTKGQYDRIQFLKNFGISDEETVIGPGINGKMNEFQAAFGLLGLEQVDQEIEDRKKLTLLYREKLDGIPGISFLKEIPNVKHNYAYFPILVDQAKYGLTRDQLYACLRECNIITRKYFYPLCSDYPCYASLPSSRTDNLPVAKRVSQQVLCLPMYGELDIETAEVVGNVISKLCGIERSN